MPEYNKVNPNKHYTNTVQVLALGKLRNDVIFEGKINKEVNRLSSMGLTVTSDSLHRDIASEIERQQIDLGLKKRKNNTATKQNTKAMLINEIIKTMNDSGDLSLANRSSADKARLIQGIQNKLNSKSEEALKVLLSSYKESGKKRVK